MAARLQGDLREPVALEDGARGEFTVTVDGATVMSRGLWVLLGALPPYDRVLSTVRAALARGAGAGGPGASA